MDKTKIISLNDCEQIIKKYLKSENFTVTDYSVQPYSDSVNGFMGDHLYINIKIVHNSLEENLRFFAKRFPFQHVLHKQYALSIKAFRNEIWTYEVLFEEFKKHCPGIDLNFAPKYYFGKDNDILVFEDLTMQGYTLPDSDKLNSLSLEEIEIVLKTVAKYHAGSIAYQEIKSAGAAIRYRFTDNYATYMPEPLFRREADFLGYGWFKAGLKGLNGVIDLLPEDGLPKREFKEKLAQVAYNSFEIIKPKPEFLNVCCHGDMWAKNAMFIYKDGKPTECKLVDFQLQRYCPPAHDVLQFIYLTTSTNTRQKHLHRLLKYYHDCLALELEKSKLDIGNVLPYEEFEGTVNHFLPQIKLQTAYYYSFQAANAEFHKRLVNNFDDFRKFVFEDRSPFAVELFKSDENYRKLLSEAIDELRDLVSHKEITIEDCFEIIRNKTRRTDYKLLQHELTPHEIPGKLESHAKLKITILADGEKCTLNLLAKLYPNEDFLKKYVQQSNAFSKQIFMNKQLFPKMEEFGISAVYDCVVRCYFARVENIIVFDDCSIQNYRLANPRELYTYDLLSTAVNNLAKYHASNMVLEEKLRESQGKIEINLGDRYKEQTKEVIFTHGRYQEICDYVIFQINLILDQKFNTMAEKALKLCFELVKSSKQFRNVICHGSLHASNVLFQLDSDQPVDCRFINFHRTRYCPPSHDLLFLIYSTTNRKYREQHMTQFIDMYHAEVSKTLQMYEYDAEQLYPYKEHVKSCAEMKVQAICQSIIYLPIIFSSSSAKKEFIAASSKNFAPQGRNELTKDMYEQDAAYKDRLSDSVHELLELCQEL